MEKLFNGLKNKGKNCEKYSIKEGVVSLLKQVQWRVKYIKFTHLIPLSKVINDRKKKVRKLQRFSNRSLDFVISQLNPHTWPRNSPSSTFILHLCYGGSFDKMSSLAEYERDEKFIRYRKNKPHPRIPVMLTILYFSPGQRNLSI